VKEQRGFSLVELMVVMVITTALSGIVLGFALDFWRSNATLESDLETFVSRENAGDSLREALNPSAGLITQNSIVDTHTNNPDPSDATNQHWLILHAIPGNKTVGSTGTTTPLFYFQAPALDSSKNLIMNGSQPYQNEFVLYMNGTTDQLLMRRLANPSATGNTTVTTCPPAQATSSCPADKVIINNLSSVDVRYFSRSGALLDYTSSTDSDGNYSGPDFPAVEVVEINLHIFKKSQLKGGADTSSQTVIRVAIRNA